MQTVLETPTFERSAERAGISDDERADIVSLLSANPTAGEIIPETGGARKLRFRARGRGKSGGYRVITYWAGEDIPVFLLVAYAKGVKANLTKAERNALREELSRLAEDYREGVSRKVRALRQGNENE
jgi:hypothetical protein